LNSAQAAQAVQLVASNSHAAIHGPECLGADPQTYLTDESGLLLTDPEGNLIVEG